MMMRAARYKPGGPENLYISEDPIPSPGETEILIQVYASAINRADTLQRQGRYAPPPGATDILGLEAVGLVHEVGSGVTRWKKGDRVMALLPGGGNAGYVTVSEEHAMAAPSQMSMHQAAAIPEVWLTAYQLLHFVGNLKQSDTVLVHAGGSGVGTAAVQLIKLFGAQSIVTAGSQAKIDQAKRLGASAGFNYKDPGGFAERVKDFTGGAGVDLVLDCVGASYWEQNTAVLKMDGRWVLYGLMGGVRVEGDILRSILGKRLQLMGSTLRTRALEYKSKLVSDFAAKALPHFEAGQLKTIIDSTFPLQDIADAHRLMESNQNTGKIIISVKDETKHEEL